MSSTPVLEPPRGKAGGAGQSVRFIREFLSHPKRVGAVAPSSRFLAEKMVEGVNFARAGVVVEYGPGTGAFTREIVARLAPGARYFAVELSPRMAREWRRRHPGLRVHRDSVANMRAICDAEGVESVDVIVSGLPWASFDEGLQRELLGATAAVLRPGGALVTFGYRGASMLPAARRFRKLLPEYFSRVSRARYVWRNLPPAFVIRCSR
ncbi:MAG: methyltransferase domain-containing protein [Phycisphaerales bacterium]